MKNEKTIIFGGSGFIGTHLTRFLLDNELVDRIYCVDISEPRIKSKEIEFIRHDIRKPFNLDVDSVDTIYNLAAVHKTPGHEDREYFETNILGAQNVCNFAKDNNIRTILFTSSISCYGPGEELKTEDSLLTPKSSYGSSKMAAEFIHREWLKEDLSRRLVILRPGVVFGEGEGGNFSRLYKSMKNRYFFFPGRKDTKKACIYVKDLVRLAYEMTRSNERLQVYNMTYPESPRIDDIVKTISDVCGVHNSDIVIPGSLLIGISYIFMMFSKIIGKKVNICPDRVKKLINSTNISGRKLANSSYKIRYLLKEAISDWYKDCNYKGLF